MKELLAGKVKTVYDTDDAEKILIKFEDKVTAWNGMRVDFPRDKGATCCLISALLFEKYPNVKIVCLPNKSSDVDISTFNASL